MLVNRLEAGGYGNWLLYSAAVDIAVEELLHAIAGDEVEACHSAAAATICKHSEQALLERQNGEAFFVHSKVHRVTSWLQKLRL
jgi:hypothetical protein